MITEDGNDHRGSRRKQQIQCFSKYILFLPGFCQQLWQRPLAQALGGEAQRLSHSQVRVVDFTLRWGDAVTIMKHLQIQPHTLRHTKTTHYQAHWLWLFRKIGVCCFYYFLVGCNCL